jgi:predicted metal-dependent hydrolase
MRRLWSVLSRRLRPVRRVNKTYQLHKEAARRLIHSRLEYFNQYYGLTYNRVSIRDQRRCWGSCSSKGNLNFSYKLLFLPPCLSDYVIVHELCHLRVLNHSTTFWNVVAEVFPDYAVRVNALRTLERTKGTAVVTLKKLIHPVNCPHCAYISLPILVTPQINQMKESEMRYVLTT